MFTYTCATDGGIPPAPAQVLFSPDVPTPFSIFEDTLYENIRLGAKIANIHTTDTDGPLVNVIEACRKF